ncbi:MAG TPA: DUF58 domain-containing protein [Spirochaetia bacterium]|nr:DUF58 domain-containing protein [Spirochaetia bacterium]
MPQLSDPERILQRLDWTVIRKLDGILQGNYRTLFRGFGLELADLREYQLTDDVRTIDWYVTARLQTPYVRQYMEDREVTAWFLLDMSPSVDFGTVATDKRKLLVDFVGVLARLLTRHGNKVGALIFSGSLARTIPARGGRMHVLRLIRELQDQPRLQRAPQTDLSLLLESALRIIGRRSLLFVVSDFLSVKGWDKPLDMLVRKHEILAVRLSDPRESELPDVGAIVFEDAETGEQLFLDTHDRGFRKRFSEAARRRREELDILLARRGVELLPLSTEGDMAKEIVRFAIERKQRRAAPAVRAALKVRNAS